MYPVPDQPDVPTWHREQVSNKAPEVLLNKHAGAFERLTLPKAIPNKNISQRKHRLQHAEWKSAATRRTPTTKDPEINKTHHRHHLQALPATRPVQAVICPCATRGIGNNICGQFCFVLFFDAGIHYYVHYYQSRYTYSSPVF